MANGADQLLYRLSRRVRGSDTRVPARSESEVAHKLRDDLDDHSRFPVLLEPVQTEPYLFLLQKITYPVAEKRMSAHPSSP
jgi:hypothetical protein